MQVTSAILQVIVCNDGFKIIIWLEASFEHKILYIYAKKATRILFLVLMLQK